MGATATWPIITQYHPNLLGNHVVRASLFREHELAFRTQYAEMKERTLAAGALLPGTPGSLYKRDGTGHAYWYRVYYPFPGKQAEMLVCRDGDDTTLQAMRERIAFSEWCVSQVSALRKLGFQVSDKAVARVLVELHNKGAFAAGLMLVGTLAYMAWLNELGVIAVSARTLDVDLARRERLRLAAPLPFLPTLQATGLSFIPVPGLPSTEASTSLKLPGLQGLRVDVLAPGERLGMTIDVPELAWAAQTVPYYDYLLDSGETAAVLAGGQCVPVRLPQAARLVWHKLYCSTQRRGFPEKAAKDRQQATLLAAALSEHDPEALRKAFDAAPSSMTARLTPLIPFLEKHLDSSQVTRDILVNCISRSER